MIQRAGPMPGVVALLLIAGCATAPAPRAPAVDRDLAQMTQMARAAYEAGALSQAVALYERALMRARVLDDPAAVGDAAYNLAVGLTLRGQEARAGGLLQEAEAELRRAGSGLADVWLVQAKIARRQGRRQEAHALAERIGSDPAAKPTGGHRALVAILRGDLACDAGEAAAARGALATARQEVARSLEPGLHAEVARLTGRLELLEARPGGAALAFDQEAGLWQDARRYPEMVHALRRAGEAYRAAGRPGPAAHRLYRAARSAWAQGERDAALAQIRSALSLAEEAGDVVLRGRALALHEEMGRAGRSEEE